MNNKTWWIIDAENLILGRLSTEIVKLLRGKHKSSFLPYKDNGDYVIVTNIKKIVVTGNKKNDKMYYTHSGYPGNLKQICFKDLLQKNPNKILFNAVKNMLPKNKLSRDLIKKLKIYSDEIHPHQPQNPKKYEFK